MTRLLNKVVTIKADAKSVKASLKRAGKLYANGALTSTHGSLRLVFDLNRRKVLPPGSYTLILTWKAGKTKHASRQRITLE